MSTLSTSTSQLAERAEALRARADAPVHGGALGGGQRARQLADRLCRDAAARPRRARARTRTAASRTASTPFTCSARRPSRTSSSSNSVCTMPSSRNTSLPGRMKWCSSASSRGLGAARIDHDEPAAARRIALALPRKSGTVHMLPLRRHRIGAEHEQEIAALDVGHGHRQPVAEHQPAGQLLRHLVERRGGEHVARAERAGEPRHVEQQAQLVRRSGCRARAPTASRAVRGEDRRQAPLDLGEGLVPARLDETAVALDQRRAQPVRVLVQLLAAPTPLGQMKPALNTSSSSPRMAATWPSRSSTRGRSRLRTGGRCGRRQ